MKDVVTEICIFCAQLYDVLADCARMAVSLIWNMPAWLFLALIFGWLGGVAVQNVMEWRREHKEGD